MRLSGSIGMAGRNGSSLTSFWLGRLRPDTSSGSALAFKETNIFPIMHVAAMKGEIVDRYPWVTAMPAVWRANSARAAPI
jgi:hypothetical protein